MQSYHSTTYNNSEKEQTKIFLGNAISYKEERGLVSHIIGIAPCGHEPEEFCITMKDIYAFGEVDPFSQLVETLIEKKNKRLKGIGEGDVHFSLSSSERSITSMPCS